MQKTNKNKKIKFVALAIATSIIFLVIPVMFARSSLVQEEPEEQDVSNTLVETQNSIEENLSRISELEGQVVKLSEENRQLQSVVTQKSTENEELQSQVKEWSDTFRSLQADLDALEKSEYVSLIVEQLRNPVMEQTETP